MNLFDIMQAAGGANPYAALASRYGLTQAEIAKAMEAFLPAFSAGLKRSTADPLGTFELMRRLALGDWRRAYEEPAFAFGPAWRQGEEAMAFLFGSPGGARAVAEQAAAFSGLAAEKLREMMPAMTAMMLGGLAAQAASANPLLDAMLKEFRASAKPPDSAKPKGPLDRYEEEQASKDAGPADLAAMQEAMAKAGLAAFEAGAAAWRQAGQVMGGGALAGNAAQPASAATGRDAFGDMLEPGPRVSEAYLRAIEDLISGARGATGRK
jgi:hypothetical protein